MNNDLDALVLPANITLEASTALLVSMLAHPVDTQISLETDRCPRCRRWLDAGWMPIEGAQDIAGYLTRYVVTVRCGGCAFQADTQHFMNRHS